MQSAAEGFTVHNVLFLSAEIFKLPNETKNIIFSTICALKQKMLINTIC